jgi:3-deoxy-manno-octulosonate cytidylyltransferase (CMP-KDO synthetase)
VEPHGNDPKQNVVAVIPARYSSTRLPGKMLLEIAGKPLILHTLEQAQQARMVSRVIVATDDARIYEAVTSAGGEAVMTSPGHPSGSDRVAEVAEGLPESSVIVNVQGDEPMISPGTIDAAVNALLSDPRADIATTAAPITSVHGELLNGNVVKVVCGDDGHALYFSRSPMPFPREASSRYDGDPGRALAGEPDLLSIFRKHTGIYVYRREYLLEFTRLAPTKLEQIEMLEQIRALENGARIKVVDVRESSIGVDTAEDFERVRRILERPQVGFREAVADDVPVLASVHVESWQRSFEGILPQDYLDGLSVEKRSEAFGKRFSIGQPYTLIVAEVPEKGIIGFVDFGPPVLEVAGYDAQIYSFYFLPEYQRMRIGADLFRKCVEAIKKAGYRSICLDSLEVSPYRGFYTKMGGRIVGKDAHKIGEVDYVTVIYGWDSLDQI